jgi:hypothetical protein
LGGQTGRKRGEPSECRQRRMKVWGAQRGENEATTCQNPPLGEAGSPIGAGSSGFETLAEPTEALTWHLVGAAVGGWMGGGCADYAG